MAEESSSCMLVVSCWEIPRSGVAAICPSRQALVLPPYHQVYPAGQSDPALVREPEKGEKKKGSQSYYDSVLVRERPELLVYI